VDDRHAGERLSLLPAAQEHVLAQEDGKERLLQAVTELSRRSRWRCRTTRRCDPRRRRVLPGGARDRQDAVGDRKASGDLDHAIRQIVSRAIASDR
jgi:type I restriction enzyme R subunit